MKNDQATFPQRIYVVIQVALLVIIVLPFIGRPFWDDELFSVRTAASLSVLRETCRLYENNMVAYYAVLAGWINVFGDGEIAVRSLSLLFAALSLVAFWNFARRFCSPLIAALSGLMMTLNPLFLFYAVEARGYSMLLLAAVLSTQCFLSLIEKPSRVKLVLYVLVTTLSVYSHYFGLFLLPVHACMVLIRRQLAATWRWLGIAWVLVLAGVSPLLIFKPASTEQLLWMAPPSGKVFLKGLSLLFGGTWFLVAFVGILVLSWRPGFAIPGKTTRQAALMASVWIFLPLFVVFLYSLAVNPLFMYRYFIWLLPAAALLVGLLVRHVWQVSPWLAGLGGLVICAQVFPALGMLREKGSGYRDATTYIASHAAKGDAVIAYPFFKADHYRYYLGKQAGGEAYLEPHAFHASGYLPGGGGWDPDPDLHRLDSIAAQARRVFLICNPGPREADTRQNRTALPGIEQQLGRRFPLRQSLVFGERFGTPTRVVVFSR